MPGNHSSPVLRVEGIWRAFDGQSVIEDISLGVVRGEVVSVIGPSGVGKTTLLKCINLLNPIDKGRIFFHDQIVCEAEDASGEVRLSVEPSFLRQRVGMVFQDWNLWPNKTVRQNIAEGPRVVLRKTKADASELANHLADRVGLRDKLDFYPHQLSGGQRQRVAIARALAMNPEVLMLDEITSALDPALVGEVLDLIAALRGHQYGLILVTHHMTFARRISDRVVFLYGGRICESGPPEQVLDNPQTPELMNFLHALEKAR